MAFQAKIKLGSLKKGPLTHTGFKGRTLKRGESFTTTSQEEAAYYQAQLGFSVTVLKGKLPAKLAPDVEPDDVPGFDGADAEEESDDDEEEREVKGTYERADLKKMSRDDLLALIKTDDDLPLKVKDVSKKASKKEVINLILDAQSTGDADADDADSDEED